VRRLLIIAYYFPPIGAAGSFRMAGFVRHLAEFGWEPTVITPLETPHPHDDSLETSPARVIRTRSIELSRLGRSSASAGRADKSPVAHGKSRRLSSAVRDGMFPDPQLGWYPFAARAGVRLAHAEPFDAVFSSSFPITAHLVGWRIHALSGLPWVAEFRDPWSDWIPKRPLRPAARRLELAIASRAARVVLPSTPLADYFSRRWGIAAAAVPHAADGSPVLPGTRPSPVPPVLTYIGSYYPHLHGSLDAVWRAVAEIRASGGSVPRIRWVGELPSSVGVELAAYGLQDTLEVSGRVPQEEAFRLLHSSSMLFACGLRASDSFASAATPSKLIEYVISGLPVLYIDNPAGDAARMLREQVGCHVVEFGDVTGARRALEQGLAGETYARETDQFTRRARTAELVQILNSTLPDR